MKPSLHFKKRYISFVLFVSGKHITTKEAFELIHQHFLSFFGELGISSLAFKLMRYNEKNGRGIIRCAREKVDEAIFCMACMNEWKGKKYRLSPISISGGMRRLSKGG